MISHQISHDPEPIRLFKSDFLEFFTHIHPAIILLIWIPVAVISFIQSVVQISNPTGRWLFPAGFVIGIFLWSLAEYLLHRFLFHYRARTPRQEKVFFLFHGVHHAQPQCKTRLVMPPVVSIPLALLFYGLFYFVIGKLFGAMPLVGVVFSGFICGYLAYDLTHYATHHFPMRSGVWKWLKRHHMRHHYKTPNQRFGVSSPLWDYVFNTMGSKTD